MKGHQYFTENKFDKLYTELKRSRKLDWNAKAVITHIINLQEKRSKSTGRQLICHQSNTRISKDLGIPASTLNKLITRLGKLKPKFFIAKAIPSETDSGYLNKTEKTIDMALLMEFLAEEKQRHSIEGNDSCHKSDNQGNAISNPYGEEVALAIEARTGLRNQVTKDQAFYQLSEVLSDSPDVFLVENDVAEHQQRFKVMNRLNFSDREKVVYSEWIEDFMKEDFQYIKELFQLSRNDDGAVAV